MNCFKNEFDYGSVKTCVAPGVVWDMSTHLWAARDRKGAAHASISRPPMPLRGPKATQTPRYDRHTT